MILDDQSQGYAFAMMAKAQDLVFTKYRVVGRETSQ